jgi:hypothetical protein
MMFRNDTDRKAVLTAAAIAALATLGRPLLWLAWALAAVFAAYGFFLIVVARFVLD